MNCLEEFDPSVKASTCRLVFAVVEVAAWTLPGRICFRALVFRPAIFDKVAFSMVWYSSNSSIVQYSTVSIVQPSIVESSTV